ncbi:MAG: hypothetical protein ABL876_14100 [Chitinophagaceae bacterium]
MAEFEITLKNEKARSYKRSLLVIIILNLLTFLFLAYVSPNNELQKKCLFASASIAISIIFHFVIKNKERVDFRGAAIGLSLYFYIRMHYYWLAIALALLVLLYFFAVRTLRLYVSASNVSYPSLPRRKIYWSQLNNMILKDGLLTIDLKNNKLIQQTVDKYADAINEQEFNDFCQQQLNK